MEVRADEGAAVREQGAKRLDPRPLRGDRIIDGVDRADAPALANRLDALDPAQVADPDGIPVEGTEPVELLLRVDDDHEGGAPRR